MSVITGSTFFVSLNHLHKLNVCFAILYVFSVKINSFVKVSRFVIFHSSNTQLTIDDFEVHAIRFKKMFQFV